MPDYSALLPKLDITLASDGTEEATTSNTPINTKNLSFIKQTLDLKSLFIEIESKVIGGGTSSLIGIRIDGSPTNSLVLTSTSATYTLDSNILDISSLAVGRHIMDIYLNVVGAGEAFLRETWVYGRVK